MIERYSDSAAAYVMLDQANMAVYKQLYRAAKAKSKLKLRVSVLPQAVAPKPVTIEDVPETAAPAPSEASTRPITREYDMQTLAQAAKLFQQSQKVASETMAQLSKRSAEITKRSDDITDLTNQLANCQAFTPTSTVPKASGPLSPAACPATGAMFAVCCNSCEKNIPCSHYHCSTCDDGDFDLCQSCVEQGITCYSEDHWLIKRTVNNGILVNSTTETIAPKVKAKDVASAATFFTAPTGKDTYPITRKYAPAVVGEPPMQRGQVDAGSNAWSSAGNLRTCNSCVQGIPDKFLSRPMSLANGTSLSSELPEHEFIHCTTCEDFDLCQSCFGNDGHGHHPKHGFAPAVPGTQMPANIRVRMSPGRNQVHHAICDGCDNYITGVRHKCMDCPDWDYCGECVVNSRFVHPNHRFAAIYEPLDDLQTSAVAHPVHMGICCDGPLCASSQTFPSYIRGIRYKCAVCHDLDFCGNCEASPANEHNKTHPLIKFKTPVRHVSVTTSGENPDGKRMPAMGDRTPPATTNSKATETVASSPGANAMNSVRTVLDMKPAETTPVTVPSPAPVERAATVVKEDPVKKEEALNAVFLHDSVSDGTILPPNHVFEQTWLLRNEGTTSWPAGCAVKFVGGDYMGHVDSTHPAGISELVSASESTVCYAPLTPGQECSFTALLRTPIRPGKMISYWRLTAPDGTRFGHRLWCEVNVRAAAAPASKPTQTVKKEEDESESKSSGSTMIFPKLEKESPDASVHEIVKPEPVSVTPSVTTAADDGYEDCEEDEWDGSEGGFLTDEEYDILDASDEEFLEEQEKKMNVKQ